jgi:hypothetical protein
MRQCAERLLGWSATGFPAAAGDPSTRHLWQRGAWQDRWLVETVRSRRTLMSHGKPVMPRGWPSWHARLACPMAAGTVRVQWHGFQPKASGVGPLSSAALSV